MDAFRRRVALAAIMVGSAMGTPRRSDGQLLTGRVTIAETGLAAARYPLRIARERGGSVTVIDSTHTAANGSFTFKGMGSGSYRLLGGNGALPWTEMRTDSISTDDVALHDIVIPQRFWTGSTLLGDTVPVTLRRMPMPPIRALMTTSGGAVYFVALTVGEDGRTARGPSVAVYGGTTKSAAVLGNWADSLRFTPAMVDGRAIASRWCLVMNEQKTTDVDALTRLLASMPATDEVVCRKFARGERRAEASVSSSVDSVGPKPRQIVLPPIGGKASPEGNGWAYLIVTVDTMGRPMKNPAPITKGAAPATARALVQNALTMTFAPATVGGRPAVGLWCLEMRLGSEPTDNAKAAGLLTPIERAACRGMPVILSSSP